jgi:two-component system, NtrC family, sensor histidine kinase HydH
MIGPPPAWGIAVEFFSKNDVDEGQLRMFGSRFGFFVRWRSAAGPLLVVLATLILIGDHAWWRLLLIGGTLAALALRVVIERRHRDEPLVVFGWATRDGAWAVLIALLECLPVLASGGIDSPLLPILIPLCFFIGTIAATRTLILFTLCFSGVIGIMAFVSARGLVPDLMPAVFGGGSGVPRSPALLYSRAIGFIAALGYAAGLSHLVRRVFRTMISDALDARDEVLREHDAHNRELTALSGELAHELKNPLANVKGLAVLVSRDVQGKGGERLEILQHEVSRMDEILQSFLTFSRPLSPLNSQAVDLRALCESVVALHEGMAHEKSISLDVTASGQLHVSCDPRKVKQILINLVQNALDASPLGAVVELVLLPGSEGDTRMEVRDRGPGIPAAVRAHLFEPGSSTKERGTGLGLALARGLARQHGGDLLLEDREGGGCTAILTLPTRAGLSTGEAA